MRAYRITYGNCLVSNYMKLYNMMTILESNMYIQRFSIKMYLVKFYMTISYKPITIIIFVFIIII